MSDYDYSLKNSTVKLSFLFIILKILKRLLVFFTGLGFKSEVKEVVLVMGFSVGLGFKSEVKEDVLVMGFGVGLGYVPGTFNILKTLLTVLLTCYFYSYVRA